MLALLKKVLANKSGAILVFVLILFASVMVVVASLLAYTSNLQQRYDAAVERKGVLPDNGCG